MSRCGASIQNSKIYIIVNIIETYSIIIKTWQREKYKFLTYSIIFFELHKMKSITLASEPLTRRPNIPLGPLMIIGFKMS